MKPYRDLNQTELLAEWQSVQKKYEAWKAKSLSLDMTRGKPGPDQLDICNDLLDLLTSESDLHSASGTDCRNYGILEGLPELRSLFGELFEVDASQVIIGGNSSLNMMYDTLAQGMTHGFGGEQPWLLQGNIKWICLTPGYDRHFGIAQHFGMELLSVPLNEEGPDMNMVRELVKDPSVKGMFCVPKYSNPSGIVYSDRVVREIAALTPAAKDFRIIWDNAYAIHGLKDGEDRLLSVYEECKKCGHEDMVFMFASTSKISFPGAGVAAMASSPANVKEILSRMTRQTIGYDKLNQLRHARAFSCKADLVAHMKRHAAILNPKFEAVLTTLEQQLGGLGVASWTNPNGGYFISMDVEPGLAKRVVALCAEAGLKLTPAGATYPYGKDPEDKNIRIAPSFPLVSDLRLAAELLTVAVRYAALERRISNNL